MVSSASAPRLGPLAAAPGDEPALALGDVAVHHLRFTPDGVVPHLADAPAGFVPWADIREITLDIPTTWWPDPRLGDTVVPLVVGLLGGGIDEASAPPTFAARVGFVEGGDLDYRVTPHYLSGYRKKDAGVAARVVRLLVDRPEVRVLLADPTALLDRLARLPFDAPDN